MNLNFKNPYVYLKLDDGSEIHVKLDDEGVVVDHWVGDDVQETTSKTYQEMIDGDEEEKKEEVLYHISAKHAFHDDVETSNLTEAKKNDVVARMNLHAFNDVVVMTMEEYHKK